jgi:putative ABC transport system permease protein
MFEKRRRPDADFAEEIRAHIQLEADRLEADGMSPEDARAAAERRFGNVLAAEERFYESGRWLWLDQLATDVCHAFRSLARYPVACVVAVVSLAAGIGGATVTLMVRQAVFTSPPPLYADPNHLSTIGMAVPDRYPAPVPAPLFQLWMEDARLGESLAAGRVGRIADVRAGDRLDTLEVRAVSPNTFSVLGVPAALGRTFEALTPDQAGPTPIVLSHRAWRNLFDGRPDVVGSEIWIDDAPHTVIGVMPEFFWFLNMVGAPMWTPLDVRALAATDTVSVVARREPGMTALELGERLQAAAAQYAETLPPDRQRIRAEVSGIEGTPTGRAVGPFVLVLLGSSVLLTLLIACTNVAMLMIAQWTTREHEIAIRASLGASRTRIVRALLAESSLIAIAGGALGLSVTLGLRAFLLGGDDAPHFNLSIDYRLFATTAVIVMGVGLLTGLAPALYETQVLHANPLRRMRLSDRVRQRWRHALVVFEIAVTVALLVVAGAMVSASQRWMSTNPGFDTYPIAVARLENATRVPIAMVRDRLASVPGVDGVAAASNVPLVAPPPSAQIALDRSGTAERSAERTFIGPGFFDTLGVPLRSGRVFTGQDDAQAPRVVIVNETLAAQLWPGRSPIGEYVWSDGVAHQVVGTVAGYRNLSLRPTRPAFYLPLAQAEARPRLHFVVRVNGDPSAMIATLRREARDVAPAEAVASAFTLDEVQDVGRREILVGVFPMAPLAATGLLLTAAGVFSVLAFAVSRRSTELAVRIAVGADRSDLMALVATQSARLVGLGLLLGVAATFALTRVAQGTGSIFDSPGWQAFAIPIIIVTLIGGIATWIPLRRALRISPAVLLRSM